MNEFSVFHRTKKTDKQHETLEVIFFPVPLKKLVIQKCVHYEIHWVYVYIFAMNHLSFTFIGINHPHFSPLSLGFSPFFVCFFASHSSRPITFFVFETWFINISCSSILMYTAVFSNSCPSLSAPGMCPRGRSTLPKYQRLFYWQPGIQRQQCSKKSTTLTKGCYSAIIEHIFK